MSDKKKKTTVYMPYELHETLMAQAKEKRTSWNNYVVVLLEDGVSGADKPLTVRQLMSAMEVAELSEVQLKKVAETLRLEGE